MSGEIPIGRKVTIRCAGHKGRDGRAEESVLAVYEYDGWDESSLWARVYENGTTTIEDIGNERVHWDELGDDGPGPWLSMDAYDRQGGADQVDVRHNERLECGRCHKNVRIPTVENLAETLDWFARNWPTGKPVSFIDLDRLAKHLRAARDL